MTIDYPGQELELFKEAKNWKRYFSSKIQPYIKGRVLEVGAGLGETSVYLINENVEAWTMLEPDPVFFETLLSKSSSGLLSSQTVVLPGTIADLSDEQTFDTIVYIDVLEHIDDDQMELSYAARHLTDQGNLIVLSPAYQSLYNKFDKAIGHYRRYNKKSLLRAAEMSKVKVKKVFFLELSGVMLLFINKLFTRESYPTIRQVKAWDRFCVPLSKLLDRLTGYRIGKTIIAVWQKENAS